jgi:uncharacterized protein YndB with AHSA1/START domain
MTTTSTDRIEKQVLLRAPRSRVWRAIADSKEFGTWFQAIFHGAFRVGAKLRAKVTYPGYEHVEFEVIVDKMEPERLFSYRWHPFAVDMSRDYSSEPMTLVEFTLEEVEGGTLLRVVESGFESIPVARRAEALKENEGGWTEQMAAIERYVRENP